MIEEPKKPSSKELGALRVEAIKKLVERGYTISTTAGLRTVAEAIADHMRWTPRSDPSVTIKRFLNHDFGPVAGAREPIHKRPLQITPQMQEAYRRADPRPLISMSSNVRDFHDREA